MLWPMADLAIQGFGIADILRASAIGVGLTLDLQNLQRDLTLLGREDLERDARLRRYEAALAEVREAGAPTLASGAVLVRLLALAAP